MGDVGMKIFLDDDPIRDSWVDDTWTIVRNNFDAVILMANAIYDGTPIEVMSFDHDLGHDTETGYKLLCFIERMAAKGAWRYVPDKMQIHSANSVGRKNMQAAIDSIERMRNEQS